MRLLLYNPSLPLLSSSTLWFLTLLCLRIKASFTTQRPQTLTPISGWADESFKPASDILREVYRSYNGHELNVTWSFTRGTKNVLDELLREQGRPNVTLKFVITSLTLEENPFTKDVFSRIPLFIWPLVIAYNIPKSTAQLQLTREQLVGIFSGRITSWSEVYATEVCGDIFVVYHADEEDKLNIFIQGLNDLPTDKQFNASFLRTHSGWPNFIPTRGNKGVWATLNAIECSIGVMDYVESQALFPRTKVNIALLQPRKGTGFVSVDVEAIENKIQSKILVESIGGLFKTDNLYPLWVTTAVVLEKKPCTSQKQDFFRFLYWFSKNSSLKRIVKNIKAVIFAEDQYINDNKCAISIFEEGNRLNQGSKDNSTIVYIGISGGSAGLILIVTVISVILVIKRTRRIKALNKDEWFIDFDLIVFMSIASTKNPDPAIAAKDNEKRWSVSSDVCIPRSLMMQWPGRYHDQVVGVRMLGTKTGGGDLSMSSKETLMWIKEKIHNNNVLRFHGLTMLGDEYLIVSSFCLRGSLENALFDDTVNFGNDVKSAIAYDIASGMAYLHSEGIVHGILRSTCCLIDSKWTVKIADWEFYKIDRLIHIGGKDDKRPFHLKMKERLLGLDQVNLHLPNPFEYTLAPEILRNFYHCPVSEVTDMYSYGILLFEIYNRKEPYTEVQDTLNIGDILKAIVTKGLRPQNSQSVPLKVRQIMEIAWSDDPTTRPSFENLKKMLRKAFPRRKQMLESMVKMLESYTESLEEEINQRDAELMMKRSQFQSLLRSSLPDSFADCLLNNVPVTPKLKRLVGVLVVDAVGIRKVGMEKRPLDMCAIINDFNFTVDRVCDRYPDIFTAFFFGDVYIIMSGLLRSTTHRNVTQLADLALELCSETCVIASDGSELTVTFTCGLHGGSVRVGVSDSQVPELSLFGSVFHRARRLNALAQPGNIMVSSEAAAILRKETLRRYVLSECKQEEESSSRCFLLKSSHPVHRLGGHSNRHQHHADPAECDSSSEEDNVEQVSDNKQATLGVKKPASLNPLRNNGRCDVIAFSPRGLSRPSGRKKFGPSQSRTPLDPMEAIPEQPAPEGLQGSEGVQATFVDPELIDGKAKKPNLQVTGRKEAKYQLRPPSNKKSHRWSFGRKQKKDSDEKELFLNHIMDT